MIEIPDAIFYNICDIHNLPLESPLLISSLYDERVVVDSKNSPVNLEVDKLYMAAPASAPGGVFFVESDGVLSGGPATFCGNTVSGIGTGGGAIYSEGLLELSDVSFAGNFLANDINGQGGALCVGGGTAKLTDVSFYNNVSLCRAGAASFSGEATITDCIFSGNTATGLSAGAVQILGTGTVENCFFGGNTAAAGGGALVVNSTAAATIIGCTFTGNCGKDGAAIAVNASTAPTISGCTFTGNCGEYGGGIYCIRGGTATISDIVFSGNTVTGDGGAVYNRGTINVAGEVTLATESDTFVNVGSLFWDLTGDTRGTLTGYQYLSNQGDDAKLFLLVDGKIESGDTFTVASGDFTTVTGKDTFMITNSNTGEDYAAVTIGGSVNYGGLGWTLTVNGTGAGATLVLSAGPAVNLATRADFNASDVSDVVIVKNRKLSVLYDRGSKFVQSATLSNLGKWTLVEPEGDYNGDTRADVLITSKTGNIRTLAGEFNTGTGSTIKLTAHNIFRYKTDEWSYRAKGDVNGDGTTDIVIVLKGEKAVEMGLKGRVVQVKTLNENGKVAETVKMGVLKSGECVLSAADVSGKGSDNILVWNVKTDMISYWKGAGAKLTDIGTAFGQSFLGAGDFNGDNADELIWQDSDGTYSVWEDLAGKNLRRIDLGAQTAGWTFRQLGDYNGDGKQEVLWAADDGRLAYSGTDNIKKLTVIAK